MVVEAVAVFVADMIALRYFSVRDKINKPVDRSFDPTEPRSQVTVNHVTVRIPHAPLTSYAWLFWRSVALLPSTATSTVMTT